MTRQNYRNKTRQDSDKRWQDKVMTKTNEHTTGHITRLDNTRQHTTRQENQKKKEKDNHKTRLSPDKT